MSDLDSRVSALTSGRRGATSLATAAKPRPAPPRAAPRRSARSQRISEALALMRGAARPAADQTVNVTPLGPRGYTGERKEAGGGGGIMKNLGGAWEMIEDLPVGLGKFVFESAVGQPISPVPYIRAGVDLARGETGGFTSPGAAVKKYYPAVHTMGESFTRTGQRLYQGSALGGIISGEGVESFGPILLARNGPYQKAWEQGQLLPTVLEDVGNVSLVLGGGSRALGQVGRPAVAAEAKLAMAAARREAMRAGTEGAGEVAAGALSDFATARAAYKAAKPKGLSGLVGQRAPRVGTALESTGRGLRGVALGGERLGNLPAKPYTLAAKAVRKAAGAAGIELPTVLEAVGRIAEKVPNRVTWRLTPEGRLYREVVKRQEVAEHAATQRWAEVGVKARQRGVDEAGQRLVVVLTDQRLHGFADYAQPVQAAEALVARAQERLDSAANAAEHAAANQARDAAIEAVTEANRQFDKAVRSAYPGVDERLRPTPDDVRAAIDYEVGQNPAIDRVVDELGVAADERTLAALAGEGAPRPLSPEQTADLSDYTRSSVAMVDERIARADERVRLAEEAVRQGPPSGTGTRIGPRPSFTTPARPLELGEARTGGTAQGARQAALRAAVEERRQLRVVRDRLVERIASGEASPTVDLFREIPGFGQLSEPTARQRHRLEGIAAARRKVRDRLWTKAVRSERIAAMRTALTETLPEVPNVSALRAANASARKLRAQAVRKRAVAEAAQADLADLLERYLATDEANVVEVARLEAALEKARLRDSAARIELDRAIQRLSTTKGVVYAYKKGEPPPQDVTVPPEPEPPVIPPEPEPPVVPPGPEPAAPAAVAPRLGQVVGRGGRQRSLVTPPAAAAPVAPLVEAAARPRRLPIAGGRGQLVYRRPGPEAPPVARPAPAPGSMAERVAQADRFNEVQRRLYELGDPATYRNLDEAASAARKAQAEELRERMANEPDLLAGQRIQEARQVRRTTHRARMAGFDAEAELGKLDTEAQDWNTRINGATTDYKRKSLLAQMQDKGVVPGRGRNIARNQQALRGHVQDWLIRSREQVLRDSGEYATAFERWKDLQGDYVPEPLNGAEWNRLDRLEQLSDTDQAQNLVERDFLRERAVVGGEQALRDRASERARANAELLGHKATMAEMEAAHAKAVETAASAGGDADAMLDTYRRKLDDIIAGRFTPESMEPAEAVKLARKVQKELAALDATTPVPYARPEGTPKQRAGAVGRVLAREVKTLANRPVLQTAKAVPGLAGKVWTNSYLILTDRGAVPGLDWNKHIADWTPEVGQFPNVEGLIPKADQLGPEVKPAVAFADSGGNQRVVLETVDGQRVLVNKEFFDLFDSDGLTWRMTEGKGGKRPSSEMPLVAFRGNDMVGMLMPIRGVEGDLTAAPGVGGLSATEKLQHLARMQGVIPDSALGSIREADAATSAVGPANANVLSARSRVEQAGKRLAALDEDITGLNEVIARRGPGGTQPPRPLAYGDTVETLMDGQWVKVKVARPAEPGQPIEVQATSIPGLGDRYREGDMLRIPGREWRPLGEPEVTAPVTPEGPAPIPTGAIRQTLEGGRAVAGQRALRGIVEAPEPVAAAPVGRASLATIAGERAGRQRTLINESEGTVPGMVGSKEKVAIESALRRVMAIRSGRGGPEARGAYLYALTTEIPGLNEADAIRFLDEARTVTGRGGKKFTDYYTQAIHVISNHLDDLSLKRPDLFGGAPRPTALIEPTRPGAVVEPAPMAPAVPAEGAAAVPPTPPLPPTSPPPIPGGAGGPPRMSATNAQLRQVGKREQQLVDSRQLAAAAQREVEAITRELAEAKRVGRRDSFQVQERLDAATERRDVAMAGASQAEHLADIGETFADPTVTEVEAAEAWRPWYGGEDSLTGAERVLAATGQVPPERLGMRPGPATRQVIAAAEARGRASSDKAAWKMADQAVKRAEAKVADLPADLAVGSTEKLRRITDGAVRSQHRVITGSLDDYGIKRIGGYKVGTAPSGAKMEYLTGELRDVVKAHIDNAGEYEALMASFRELYETATADSPVTPYDLLDVLRAHPIGKRLDADVWTRLDRSAGAETAIQMLAALHQAGLADKTWLDTPRRTAEVVDTMLSEWIPADRRNQLNSSVEKWRKMRARQLGDRISAGLQAMPAKYRTVALNAGRARAGALAVADELALIDPAAADNWLRIAADVPDTLSKLAHDGLNPTHLIGGPPPKFVPGRQGGIRRSVLRQSKQRTTGLAPMSLTGTLQGEAANAIQIIRNKLTDHIENQFGRPVSQVLAGALAEWSASHDGEMMPPAQIDEALQAAGYRNISKGRLPTTSSLVVPEGVARAMRAAEKELGVGWRGLARFNRAYKTMVLPFSVRWYVGNVVGNMMMLMGPGRTSLPDLVAYARVLGPVGPNPRKWAQRIEDIVGGGGLDVGQVRAGRIATAGLTMGERKAFHFGDIGEQADPRTVLGRRIIQPVSDFGYRANELVDNVFRSVNYLDALERQVRTAIKEGETLEGLRAPGPDGGLSKIEVMAESAVESSLKAMGDFSRMTPFQRRKLRQIVPFFAWLRHSTQMMLRLPIESPARAAFLLHLADLFNDDELPQWMAGKVRTPWGYIDVRFLSPFEDVTASPLILPTEALRSVSPAIKITTAGLTGIDLNKSSQISRPPNKVPRGTYGEVRPMPLVFRPRELIGYTTGQVPLTRNLRDVVQGPQVRYPSGYRVSSGGVPLETGRTRLGALAAIFGIPLPEELTPEQQQEVALSKAKARTNS